MTLNSNTIPLRVTTGVVSNNDSKSEAKHQATVAAYATVSRSILSPHNENITHNDATELETEEPDEPIEHGWMSASREWSMVFCFAIMAMMVTMHALILVPILPDIAKKYDSNPSTDTMWPITVYLLANATFQRCHVAVMEIFGRRNTLMAGLTIFTLGSVLLSVLPPMFPMLLVGRGLQGAGAAAMISIPPAMLMDMIPERRRSIYNFIISFGSAAGAVLGLILGGIFIQKHFWKWIFYASAPFCFVLFIITPFAVQPVGESLESKKRLMNVDWTGSLLFAASMTALLLGLTWASTLQRQLKWQVLVALVAGAVGMIVTMLYERSGASRPMLSLGILKVSPVTFLCVLVQSLLIAVQLVYVPEYLRQVHKSSNMAIGAALIAMVVTMLLVMAAVDLIPTKLYHYRWPLWLGWAVNIASSGSLTLLDIHTKLQVCIVIMVFAGVGHGITISATHGALRDLSRQKSRSYRDASLIANFVRTTGFCLAIASAESAFLTRLHVYKVHYSSPHMYAASFEDLMRVLTALAGFGAVLSLSVGWRARRGSYLSS